jgi:drug/metabolite transporter (DMT)-like permease
MFKQKAALLYPFVAIVLWAGNVIVSRLSAHTIGPQAITFYRLLVAVLLMSPFVARAVWRNRLAIWPHLGPLAILGFLAMCLFQSLSYLAAETTTATNMAVFTALTPLLTVALSAALLGEQPTFGMICGAPLSFAGLIYLVSGGDFVITAAQRRACRRRIDAAGRDRLRAVRRAAESGGICRSPDGSRPTCRRCARWP